MPAGYQQWDASGNLILDTSTIVGRFFGKINIGGAGSAKTGSVTNAKFSQGTPFYVAVNTLGVDVEGYGVVITFSGNTMTWTYPQAGNTGPERPNATIVYGVHTV